MLYAYYIAHRTSFSSDAVVSFFGLACFGVAACILSRDICIQGGNERNPSEFPAEGVSEEPGRSSSQVGRGGANVWEQLGWLLWKRRVVATRDWRGGLYQVLLPALLVALVLLLLTIDLGLAGPPLVMSAAMFEGSTQVRFVGGDGEDVKAVEY